MKGAIASDSPRTTENRNRNQQMQDQCNDSAKIEWSVLLTRFRHGVAVGAVGTGAVVAGAVSAGTFEGFFSSLSIGRPTKLT